MLKFKSKEGFTLIELMIVVAILGVLSSIAIPAFIKYVKQSKTSESGLNLKTLADGASAYYEADHYTVDGLPVPEKMFPTPAGTLADKTASKVPAAVPKGTKHPTRQADWAGEPWRSLKFIIAKPHYYRYHYRSSNAANATDRFSTRAEGDLDADADSSRFNLNGQANASGEVLMTPVFLTDLAKELE